MPQDLNELTNLLSDRLPCNLVKRGGTQMILVTMVLPALFLFDHWRVSNLAAHMLATSLLNICIQRAGRDAVIDLPD